jgi:hypothetical protein
MPLFSVLDSQDTQRSGLLFHVWYLGDFPYSQFLHILAYICCVKEQVAGQYAQRIAKAGYITLAIDHRHFGGSDGMPRQHEEPAKKMEDFKNAISFLSSLNDVDNQHGDMNRNISNQQIENLKENTKVNGKDKLFMKLIFKYFLRNGA